MKIISNMFKISLLACAMSSIQAAELNTLQNISYSEKEGQFRLVLDFANQQATKDFHLNPQGKELLIDIDNVSYNMLSDTFNTDSSIVKNIKLHEKNENLQMIVSMNEMQPYNISKNGNKIELVITPDNKIKNNKSVDKLVQELTTDTIINAVDFERVDNHQGKIKIGYTSKNAVYETVEKEDHIEISFPKAKLISDLFRKLDVKDLGTPIDYIISKIDPDTNMVVVKVYYKNKLKVKPTVSQLNRSIELKVQDEVSVKEKENIDFTGEKISFNFQDIPVRNVLQMIAQKMGVNLVIGDNVQGNITLQLNDVPYDQALDIILKTKDLDKRVNGNVMLVSTFQDLIDRETKELKSREDLRTLATIEQKTFQIKYAKAKTLTEVLQKFSTPRGSIVFDERTNKLIISDTSERLIDIQKKIESLDIPVRQVVIESRIVFAKDNAQKDLGVAWGMSGVRQSGSGNIIASGTKDGLTGIGSNLAGGGTGSLTTSPVVNMGVANATSGIAVGFLSDTFSLDVALSALETTGEVEIVARPKVITADQKTANIESGKEYPYMELSDNGNSGVSFKKILLSLGVTPQITPNDKIMLDLKIVQDSVAELTDSGPAIDSTKIDTQVLANNGETIVLGGIFKSDLVKSEDKTPLLGDIPVLGRLFKKTSTSNEKSELIIFITPKIVNSEIIPSEE